MDEERIGIELIVSVIVWFALVLVAFFFVGAAAPSRTRAPRRLQRLR